MLHIVIGLFLAFRSAVRSRRDLALENLALRQQVVVATTKIPSQDNFRRLAAFTASHRQASKVVLTQYFVERGVYPTECLDQVIVFNERHLRRVLTKYLDYYHGSRTHWSLDKDAPETRPVELPEVGAVSAVLMVGRLHQSAVCITGTPEGLHDSADGF